MRTLLSWEKLGIIGFNGLTLLNDDDALSRNNLTNRIQLAGRSCRHSTRARFWRVGQRNQLLASQNHLVGDGMHAASKFKVILFLGSTQEEALTLDLGLAGRRISLTTGFNECTGNTLRKGHHSIVFDDNFFSLTRPFPADTGNFKIGADDLDRAIGISTVFQKSQRGLGAGHREF